MKGLKKNYNKKLKFYLVGFCGLCLITASLYISTIFSYRQSFDIRAIKNTLSDSSEALTGNPIRWEKKEDGSIIGHSYISKINATILYSLTKTAVSSETIFDISQDISSYLPCININHILNKKQIRELYKQIVSNKSSFSYGDVDEISFLIEGKLHVAFYKKITTVSATSYCSIYYK